jgi:hypothetical protein
VSYILGRRKAHALQGSSRTLAQMKKSFSAKDFFSSPKSYKL